MDIRKYFTVPQPNAEAGERKGYEEEVIVLSDSESEKGALLIVSLFVCLFFSFVSFFLVINAKR